MFRCPGYETGTGKLQYFNHHYPYEYRVRYMKRTRCVWLRLMEHQIFPPTGLISYTPRTCMVPVCQCYKKMYRNKHFKQKISEQFFLKFKHRYLTPVSLTASSWEEFWPLYQAVSPLPSLWPLRPSSLLSQPLQNHVITIWPISAACGITAALYVKLRKEKIPLHVKKYCQHCWKLVRKLKTNQSCRVTVRYNVKGEVSQEFLLELFIEMSFCPVFL